jgi:chemotaxis protein MotB
MGMTLADQGGLAPVIIKRKKVVAGGGHHGGAWKVAYADFVTAMMAFFMLMWLLNATTEKQRKGLADYFNPTIPLNRISGGGDGAFGGTNIFSEEQLAQNGTGGTALQVESDSDAKLKSIEGALMGFSGESLENDELLRHILVRTTDQGLVVEVFDTDEDALFGQKTAEPTETLLDILGIINQVFSLSSNQLSIGVYTASQPLVIAVNPVWDLSSSRASRVRLSLEAMGFDPNRMHEQSGFADKSPAVSDLLSARNNRIELILLRNDR